MNDRLNPIFQRMFDDMRALGLLPPTAPETNPETAEEGEQA